MKRARKLPKLDDISTKQVEQIHASGLDNERQWYLYEEIRDFCYSEIAKDIACPKPLVPKEEKVFKFVDDLEQPIGLDEH